MDNRTSHTNKIDNKVPHTYRIDNKAPYTNIVGNRIYQQTREDRTKFKLPPREKGASSIHNERQDVWNRYAQETQSILQNIEQGNLRNCGQNNPYMNTESPVASLSPNTPTLHPSKIIMEPGETLIISTLLMAKSISWAMKKASKRSLRYTIHFFTELCPQYLNASH